MLLLLTDGEIRWDEDTNDFDWATTTALGSAFAGAFAEEPLHVDMRWARSETQLDLTDGRFRDQIADLAAPVERQRTHHPDRPRADNDNPSIRTLCGHYGAAVLAIPAVVRFTPPWWSPARRP